MAGRRREQQKEVFRTRYRRRSGIESTNSGLKRRTGLGRLRVRGRARVF
ncbi:MAG: transposase [Planctomycetes bacterium]|nr:transposase [Planctomycetota bacterium]